jgi:hypothetical protein
MLKGMCFCLLGTALNLPASPLKRADVAADPSWVLHLDCDTLRPTVIGQFVLAEMDKPDAKAHLASFESLFSFDPRKQLHGLTLYSTGKVPEDGVLLVYADFDAERLTNLAKSAKEHESKKHNQHEIHSWIDDRKRGKDGSGQRTYAAIHGKRLIVFAQHASRVGEALDVLDRTSPSLASSSNFGQLGSTGIANFIEGGARKLDLSTSDPNAAIFRLSKLIRLQVGETQRRLTASLSLETNDEETAKQVSSVVQGLAALVKLQQAKPELVKLADALLLKQDGSGLVATLSLPADDVVAFIKADAARKEKSKAEKAEKAAKAEAEQ